MEENNTGTTTTMKFISDQHSRQQIINQGGLLRYATYMETVQYDPLKRKL